MKQLWWLNLEELWIVVSSLFFCDDDLLTENWFVVFGKTFQNLSVSSPAPVTIVWESGLIAR